MNTFTYVWRARSGVLVTSCVPRAECGRLRALVGTYAYYLRGRR